MPEKLLDDVKSYLHITWQDENTEKNLIDAINSSKARLQEIAGVPLDFNKEGLARDLLKDRCRYINSNALEMFEKNFAMELINLHIQGQVSAMGSETNENKS
ncbi:hypothetical protein [Clostridium botulinum]|uniref:hypothetical protein n=1 Tax=Clostridium botulinum TaxID=1491 RepID=UPI003EF2B6ED